ncbi:glutamate receptor ionotropic, delta-2-like [Penaeus chinensis]|uniref:glutamate receptor ionotropic, delta-2-like n=1 Tax=Penaeus chinensis TaxID=139456 RepID=UPI001FB78256|nr:glutamate receptor ionotropic, delta-2-like [Penaeus chinensis]
MSVFSRRPQNPPFIKVEDAAPPYKVSGTQVYIFEVLMKYLGRCHEWVIPEVHGYGYQQPNGSWVGVIGSVHNGRADLSMALGHSIDRAKVVDFSENLYMEEFAIAYKRPKLASDIIGFIRPFALSLWITVFVATLFVCATTWLILRSHSALSGSRRTGREGAPGTENQTHFLRDVEESVRWTICHLIGQAVPQEPAGNGPRIAGGLWLLSAFILGVVYRGNLKAMLILPRVVLPFDTLQELTETNIPIWIPEGNLVHKAILAATPDSAYYRLRKQMLVHLDVPRGIRNTFNGLHAVASPMTTIVSVIDVYFSTTVSMGLVMSRTFDQKTELNRAIKRLKEFGIIEFLRANDLFNATECLKPLSSSMASGDLRALDIVDFLGVCAIYASGITVAAVVFVLELVLGRRREGRGKKGGKNTKNTKITKDTEDARRTAVKDKESEPRE